MELPTSFAQNWKSELTITTKGVIFRIRTEATILSRYGEKWIREKPYSDIFYAVFVQIRHFLFHLVIPRKEWYIIIFPGTLLV